MVTYEGEEALIQRMAKSTWSNGNNSTKLSSRALFKRRHPPSILLGNNQFTNTGFFTAEASLDSTTCSKRSKFVVASHLQSYSYKKWRFVQQHHPPELRQRLLCSSGEPENNVHLFWHCEVARPIIWTWTVQILRLRNDHLHSRPRDIKLLAGSFDWPSSEIDLYFNLWRPDQICKRLP